MKKWSFETTFLSKKVHTTIRDGDNTQYKKEATLLVRKIYEIFVLKNTFFPFFVFILHFSRETFQGPVLCELKCLHTRRAKWVMQGATVWKLEISILLLPILRKSPILYSTKNEMHVARKTLRVLSNLRYMFESKHNVLRRAVAI